MNTLFVASGIDHLMQLHELASRLTGDRRHDDKSEHVWFTTDVAFSHSLLEEKSVVYARSDRDDLITQTRNMRNVLTLLNDHHIDQVISLGDSMAFPTLAAARIRNVAAMYIEDFALPDGPSNVGRRVAHFRNVTCYTQHPRWANEYWTFGGTAFDRYTTLASRTIPPVHKLAVLPPTRDTTLFQQLTNRLRDIVPLHTEVDWITDFAVANFAQRIRDADAVIGATGPAGALLSLQHGRLPLLIPSVQASDDATDTSFWLQAKGLAVSVSVEELKWHDVSVAASWQVTQALVVPEFPTAIQTGNG